MNVAKTSKKPVIQLKGLSKSFDGKQIITGLDLDVNDGEFLTILGPSGCGKTTVLRLIAGFETADNGQITIANKDVTDIPAEQRLVNTVFQSYALFPHMTVFENVAFGLRMQKVPSRDIEPRVMEALRMVQLDKFALVNHINCQVVSNNVLRLHAQLLTNQKFFCLMNHFLHLITNYVNKCSLN